MDQYSSDTSRSGYTNALRDIAVEYQDLMCGAVLQAAAVAEAELRSRVPASSPSPTNEQPRHYKVHSPRHISVLLFD